MTTTTSFSKQGQFRHLYKQTLRQYAKWELFYFALILLGTVLPVFAGNYGRVQSEPASSGVLYLSSLFRFGVTDLLSGAVIVGAAIVPAAFLYHYLYDKRQIDFYHALPVPRKILFFSKYAAGLTLILLPMMLCQILAGSSYFIFPVTQAPRGVLALAVGAQIIKTAIVQLSVFSIASFAAVSSSTVVEMLAGSCALTILGSGLYAFWGTLSDILLYGYDTSRAGELLSYFSPPALLSIYPNESGWFGLQGGLILAGWVLGSVLLTGAAVKRYEKRHSEYAAQWGRDSKFGTIIKLFGALVTAFILGLYLFQYFGMHTWHYLLGITVGGPLGYLAAEVVTAKGFSTLRKALPKIGGTFLLALLTSGYFVCGGLGFETRIPKLSSLESADLWMSPVYQGVTYYDPARIKTAKSWSDLTPNWGNEIVLTEPETMQKVVALHESAIENRPYLTNYTGDGVQIFYQKQLGVMNRYYELGSASAHAILDLQLSPEWIEKKHPLFRIVPAHVSGITVADKLGNLIQTEPLDESQIQQLIDAGRKDLLADTPEQFLDLENNRETGVLWFNLKSVFQVRDEGISPLLDIDTCYLFLRPSYTNTISLLTEWGMMPPKETDTQAVEQLEIALSNDSIESIRANPPDRELFYNNYEGYLTKKITDRDLIQKIIERSSNITVNGVADHAVRFVVSDPTVKTGKSCGTLRISNADLLELLDGSGIKIPYLLTSEELEDYVRQKGYRKGVSWSAQSALQESFMEEEYALSVGEYFEKYMPERLNEKPEIVKRAMYETPFENEAGKAILYSRYLNLF